MAAASVRRAQYAAAMRVPQQIVDFIAALDATEKLPRPKLHLYQRQLIEQLVRHARDETEYYAGRLSPLFRRDDSIDWSRWAELPIVTRADAQDHFDALCAKSTPLNAGPAQEDTSSGSTGRPLRFLTSQIQDVASACASERFFRWHGIDPAKLMVRIRAVKNPKARYPHGSRRSAWRAGDVNSEVYDLSIATSTEDQIEWLQRVRPDYIASYPSNLREIVRKATAAGIELRFDAVLSFGEMVSLDMRETIERYFGRPVLDRYGASEIGQIAAMCPQAGRYHVTSELTLLEVVDEDGSLVPAGTPGRIVVTPLYNYAMPLIRYHVGDYGVLSPDPCECGRTLPVLERICGRSRNIFRFVDGSTIWPVLMSRDIHSFVPIKQFQVVQITHTDIELRYVPSLEERAPDLDGLTNYIRTRLHPSVNVQIKETTDIPRSAGGKFEDCMSLVAGP